MVKYLFTLPDVSVFLSQRISQDPLENFFGCQCQRGGTHDNPNVQEFQNNMQALRVINSFIKTPVKGNCRGSGDMDMESLESMSTPLPKRKRKRTTPPANSSIQQPLTTNSQVTQTTTSTNSQPSLTVATLTHNSSHSQQPTLTHNSSHSQQPTLTHTSSHSQQPTLTHNSSHLGSHSQQLSLTAANPHSQQLSLIAANPHSPHTAVRQPITANYFRHTVHDK